MPAKSAKQQRYMGMLAHDSAKRKQAGVSKKVAEEFAHKPPGGYGAAAKRSTKGSPAMTVGELRQGYRRVP